MCDGEGRRNYGRIHTQWVLGGAGLDEVYDRDELLARQQLAQFLTRTDVHSAVRLIIHLGTVAFLIAATVQVEGWAWRSLTFAAAAFAMGALFAPFHECTHSTAFRSPALNRCGVAITGILFGTSWHYYRAFHYEHHAHTQDPGRDPEIRQDPERLSPWPKGARRWLVTLSGMEMLVGKLRAMITSWLPRERTGFKHLPERAQQDSRVICTFWLAVVVLAAAGNPYAAFLGAAFVLGHVALGLWLTAEHTGCSERGSIVERTRSMRSNAVMRFFIWNMNYHTEHHAWPGVPWHALPRLHRAVRHAIALEPSYLGLYLRQMRATPNSQTGARL